MKTTKLIAAFAAAAALISACGNGPKKVAGIEAELPTASQIDSVSYLIGINFGYFVKSNGFGEDLNYAEMKKGMLDFINAKGNMNAPEFNEQFKVNPEAMNELFNAFLTKMNNYNAEVNLKEGEDFLAKNKMKDGIVETASGLQYKIIEPGNDVKPAATDTVYVHYKGTLINGDEFDASDPEGQPVKLMLNGVIAGWTEGLQLLGEGGKAQLYIPASLGYGERAMGSIPANSTLIFDVELVKVGKAPVAEEKAAE